MSVGSTKRGMTAVAFDRLCVSLGGTQVLHEVSAAVEPGEWVAVIGPNGAGKTTPFAAPLDRVARAVRRLDRVARRRPPLPVAS